MDTYSAPFGTEPFSTARFEVAVLLAGWSLQEGTLMGIQHLKLVLRFPNTDDFPLLGATATFDGTLDR